MQVARASPASTRCGPDVAIVRTSLPARGSGSTSGGREIDLHQSLVRAPRSLAAMEASAHSALASIASTAVIVTIDAIVDSATAPETDASACPERLANA